MKISYEAITIIHLRGDDDSHEGDNNGGKRGSDSRHILKVETRSLTN